jgi:hypothetical protein
VISSIGYERPERMHKLKSARSNCNTLVRAKENNLPKVANSEHSRAARRKTNQMGNLGQRSGSPRPFNRSSDSEMTKSIAPV